MTPETDLPPDERARLRELCSKVTPGPWKCWDGWGPHTDGLMRVLRLGPALGPGPEVRDGLYVNDGGDIVGRSEDFEFIAHARTALPAALDRVEALEQRHAALWDTVLDFIAAMALHAEDGDLTHDRVLHWAERLREHAPETGVEKARG